MSVKLTCQIEGKNVGDTYSGPREEWLVLMGYATRGDGKQVVVDPGKVPDVQVDEAEKTPRVLQQLAKVSTPAVAVPATGGEGDGEPTPPKPKSRTTRKEAEGTTVEKS